LSREAYRPSQRFLDGVHPAEDEPHGKKNREIFPSKNQALKFIQDFKREHDARGTSGVSAQDREWIAFARNKLGNLSLLPEVIRHWERTGAHLEPMATEAAVQSYFDAVLPSYKRVTRYDVTSRLGKFASHFGKKPLHEIRPADVEDFLGTISAGGNRWSSFKRIRPFFKFAKRRNWISTNVMEEIPAPKVERPSREVYSVSDFHQMLWMAEGHYPPLLPFVVLSGYCFLRTSELVKTFREDKVLRWENVLSEIESNEIIPLKDFTFLL
jgi:hypothetical protein